MSALKLAALKELCQERKLPTSGTKAELVSRLLDNGVPESELQLSTAGQSSTQESRTEDGTHQERPSSADQQLDNPLFETEAPGHAMPLNRPPFEIELLRRERQIAAREIQLLRRELEMARLIPQSDGSSTSAQARRGVWKDVKEMVGDYDGSSAEAEAWERQMRRLIEVHGLEAHTAKALICHKLKRKALRWYQSKPDCVDLTYDELLSGLRGMFGQRPNVLDSRRDFERRAWKTGETFADYVHEKLILGNKVPIADNEIVDYDIEGIPDENIKSVAYTRGFRTVEEVVLAYARMTLPEGTRRQKTGQRRETDPPVNNYFRVKKIVFERFS